MENNGKKNGQRKRKDTGMEGLHEDKVHSEAIDITHRTLREHGLDPFTSPGKPVLRPPLKGVSATVPEPPMSEVVVLTDKSRREIELTTQIDALIKTRRTLREDIIKMVDVICDPVEEITGLPPRGALRGPRIISDVQLVPSRSGALLDKEVPGDCASTKIETNMKEAAGSSRMWTEAAEGGEPRHSSSGSAKRARKRRRLRNEERGSVDVVSSVNQGGPIENSGMRTGSTTPSLSGKRRVSGTTTTQEVRPLRERGRMSPPPPPKRRPPKTVAITITGKEANFSYADALRKARENISLPDLGIERSKVRRTINGGVLLEIIGPDGATKADALRLEIERTYRQRGSNRETSG